MMFKLSREKNCSKRRKGTSQGEVAPPKKTNLFCTRVGGRGKVPAKEGKGSNEEGRVAHSRAKQPDVS